nr:hypothetical protein [Tanacetum cinerariifolium]
MMSCTIKGKPLVLSWGRTPRLNSSVRAEVGPSSGKGPLIIVTCGLGLVQRTSDVLQKRPLEAFRPSCCFWTVVSWFGLSSDSLCLNDHFLWVDSFACPSLFPWHTAKNVTRDPAPVAADFNARDYAIPVAHPSPFRKFPEEFLCLVGPSRHYALDEDGSFCFQSYSGSYQITPDRADSKLETSIDRLFDEGGSGSQAGQGGYAGVGEGTNIQPVIEATDIVIEDVAPLQPRRQRKRKTVVADAGGSLLAGAVMNDGVRGEPIPTLPFVTSSVSATLEREGGDHTDSVTRLNLRTISAPQRFVISSDSSHHSGANVTEAEVDSFVRSSVPVMTAVTITTSTANLPVVVKENLLNPLC